MISRSELARRAGVDRITLWRWERDGLIPTPIRTSPRRVAYPAAAVAAIVAFAEAAR